MVKIKLPKRIRVLTRWYTVKWNNDLDASGQCDWHLGLISINLSVHKSKEQVVRTFWHEIAHAYAWESGLYSTRMSSDAHEFFAETFSALICDLTDGKIRQRR